TMLGYTEAELDEYFAEHMHDHAKALEMDYDAYRAELKRWFNGYRFWKFKGESVYNPVSIGMNMSKREPEFKSYWRTTGKASMLMNYIKRDGFLSIDMESVRGVQEDDFDVSDIRDLKPVPMLYQTGYLTISDYNRFLHLYELRAPNEEVRKDLAILTAAAIADRKPNWVTALGSKLLLAEWDEFFDGLKALYAALPYGSKEGTVHEFSYERCLYILLKSQAIRCTTEDRQANGQADIVHPNGKHDGYYYKYTPHDEQRRKFRNQFIIAPPDIQRIEIRMLLRVVLQFLPQRRDAIMNLGGLCLVDVVVRQQGTDFLPQRLHVFRIHRISSVRLSPRPAGVYCRQN
ncbi:MAG: AAA family ATPase, partial [Lentisphaeria bacterium]|nr:AAA family ATPase [Lentisphaeria bacterium]